MVNNTTYFRVLDIKTNSTSGLKTSDIYDLALDLLGGKHHIDTMWYNIKDELYDNTIYLKDKSYSL